MKAYSLMLSLIMISSALPLVSASETTENVAVVVSTPADAIVAAPYAKAMGYKLIYTPTDELSDDAKREIERNNIDKIIIVGGPVAVSNNVENKIKELNINTQRVWGETRVETSQKMYELIKKDKPELLNKIVVADGFNEKIAPVAVSFNAPVLYYGLNKDDEVADLLKTAKPEYAVILGKDIPKTITKTLSEHAKNTIIASGNDDTIIKTALAYVPKINPEAENKNVAVVYAEKTNDPILDAVVSFVNGDVGAIAPIPVSNEDMVNKIISKLTFASEVSISSDSTSMSDIISNIASKIGLSSTSIVVTPSGGGGGTATVTSVQPVDKPAIKVIANGKTIEFEGQDSNTLSITGTKTINLPKITAEVNVVDKKDASKGVEIYFKDNASVKSIIEAMNDYTKVSYSGDNIVITYNNPDMDGKNVTLSVISDRGSLRDAINKMLNGNATDLIGLIEMNQYSKYNCVQTVSGGSATWTLPASDFSGDVGVIITEGGYIPWNATYVKVLAVGGFEVMKYNMTLTFIETNPITNDSTYNISINDTPSNNIRYGLAMIDKNTGVTINVVGTNPNNNLFNVSVVGNNGSEIIVENNDFITLNASKINDIVGTIFTPDTASATYSPSTTNSTVTLKLQNISNAYVIGIAYDTVDKKLVAIEQQ